MVLGRSRGETTILYVLLSSREISRNALRRGGESVQFGDSLLRLAMRT